jgi:hypothetical protein
MENSRDWSDLSLIMSENQNLLFVADNLKLATFFLPVVLVKFSIGSH